MARHLFTDISIVSCGTMSLELNHLRKEGFLEYSDWMGIPIIPYAVNLDRFKELLLEQADKLHRQ